MTREETMRRALALDTSGWWGGVALVEQASTGDRPEVVAECGLRITDSHTPGLLRRIDWLLAEAGWDKRAVDLFVAVRGPGSFSGVRIGLGTVRGLGVAAGRPVAGVVSLEAMAESFGPAEARRVPLISAGRGEIYGAVYGAAGSPPAELCAPWLGAPRRAVQDDGAPAVLFGSGTDEVRAVLDRPLRGVRFGASPQRGLAAAAGRLALLAADPADLPLAPLYLRPPDALLGTRKR